ncbi:MAG: glycosyltransferase [Bacteroidota bacterium]
MEVLSVGLPKVAVLMATYNGEKYLRQQMDSILAQQNVDVSVFVRDDHSSDTTVSIINEYAERTGKVFLLARKPAQLRVTKNFYSIVKEVDLSDADFMAYSDQDDVWLPAKMDAAINALTNSHSDAYASNLLRGDTEGRIMREGTWLKRLIQYLFNRKSSRQTLYDHYFEAASAGCTLVLSKKAAQYFQKRVQEIYDTIPSDTSHDWSTYAITRIGGFKWYIDEHSYIIYRQHAENAYGANIGFGGINKMLEWFTSGRYRMHILMIDNLYNNTGIHPDFMAAVKNYKPGSILSRFRMAFAVHKYRRKWTHRILLFLLIILGYCK